jgi:hypothetical protein
MATRWRSCRRPSCTARRDLVKYDEKKEDKGQYLLRQVKTRGAEGVVFAAPSFCDPALLERPMLQEMLSEAQDSLHRVQVRREHRPDGADPRAGGHLRRLDQAVERVMHETPQ